jgi:hypothetical protein
MKPKSNGDRVRDPRPADLAIEVNGLICTLATRIWQIGYLHRTKTPNLGRALPTMFVSFVLSTATRKGKPAYVSKIVKALAIPDTNVRQHLKWLEGNGRVTRVGKRYISNLNYLDRKISRSTIDATIALIETTLAELKRLRAILYDDLPEHPHDDATALSEPPPPES